MEHIHTKDVMELETKILELIESFEKRFEGISVYISHNKTWVGPSSEPKRHYSNNVSASLQYPE